MMEKDNEKRQLVISPTTDSQDFYEQLVNEYPTCGRFWKAYIENELKARNFEKVEKLFQRCLLKVLNVELWRCYLNYVRDVKSKMPNHKEKTAQAYDFALEKIGLDVQSYSIWVDYINFLKSVEAIGSFAENQKITAIRKVYQKGVMNPMLNVDQLWKDYCIFENQINPLIAKRMIDDRSRDYMSVRKIAKEYENVTRPLDRTSPGLPIPTGTADELRQKQMWRKYIEWERTSPTLRGANNNATTTTNSGGGGGGGGGSGNVDDSLIMTTSPAILHHVAKRVMYAYEQWLLAMPKHPDIWVEYAAYLQEQSARMADKSGTSTSASASSDVGAWARVYAQEAVQVFERALAVCSSCPLVYFAYADFEEGRLNHTKVKEIYDKLLEKKEIDPSLCYIQYMRFLRRVEGIRSARTVFKRARDDPRSSYHVYMAAAFMEYYCTKDISIAYKILQSGLKQFGHIPEFVLGFIELAKHINDNDTIKHLFETVLNNDQNDISVQMNKEKTEQIWLEWLDFERNANTSLEAIEDVAQKRQAFYLSQPNASSMFDERQSLLLIDRYSYHSLRPCTQLELASIGYKPDCALLALDLQPLLTTHHQQQAHHATITSSPTSNDDESGEKRRSGSSKSSSKSAWPEPDPSRMIAFKPSRRAEFGFMQPIPGGGMFLFPSIFADLIKRLPPPHCFQGPFVNIDEFIVNFKNLTIPEDFQKFQVEDSIKNMQDGADDDEIESDAPKQQRNQRKPSSSSTAATTSSR